MFQHSLESLRALKLSTVNTEKAMLTVIKFAWKFTTSLEGILTFAAISACLFACR